MLCVTYFTTININFLNFCLLCHQYNSILFVFINFSTCISLYHLRGKISKLYFVRWQYGSTKAVCETLIPPPPPLWTYIISANLYYRQYTWK